MQIAYHLMVNQRVWCCNVTLVLYSLRYASLWSAQSTCQNRQNSTPDPVMLTRIARNLAHKSNAIRPTSLRVFNTLDLDRIIDSKHSNATPNLESSRKLKCNPRANYSTTQMVHRDSPEDNASLTFEFSPEVMPKVTEIISRYPVNYKRSAMIPLLDVAQQQNNGHLSLGVMNKIAEMLEVAPIRVYEVATFYSMFNRQKMGKLHVMVCGTTPCMLRGARDVEKALSEYMGVNKFETTSDGMFTLGEMECMGCCVNAPMIAVADYRNGVQGYTYNYYEDLTPKTAVQICQDLKSGKTPRVGSQIRDKAEPLTGYTTLLSDPPGPYCRDLNKLKLDLEAAAKAEADAKAKAAAAAAVPSTPSTPEKKP